MFVWAAAPHLVKNVSSFTRAAPGARKRCVRPHSCQTLVDTWFFECGCVSLSNYSAAYLGGIIGIIDCHWWQSLAQAIDLLILMHLNCRHVTKCIIALFPCILGLLIYLIVFLFPWCRTLDRPELSPHDVTLARTYWKEDVMLLL